MKLKSTENWNDQCFFLAYFILNREVYLQKKKKKKKNSVQLNCSSKGAFPKDSCDKRRNLDGNFFNLFNAED